MKNTNEVPATSNVAPETPSLTIENLRKVAENVAYETKLSTIDAIIQMLLQTKKVVVNSAR